ncbi:MAG: DUF4238 domain-containing protein [Betaproteobacteria bacterium]
MGNHYIPQYYLRGFEQMGRIWVFDSRSGHTFESQAKSIANENDMYPKELEELLANDIEAPANGVLSRLRDFQAPTETDKALLAKYMFVLWKRVPKGRARARKQTAKVADQVHLELQTELDALAKSDPSKAKVVTEGKARIAEVIERRKLGDNSDIWHLAIPDASPRILDAMLSMHWVYLYHDTLQFLTCDNPVCFFEREGLASPKAELLFPISSAIALLATRTRQFTDEFISAKPAGVKEMNRRIAKNAERFVYFKKNEPWIEPFITKGDWRISRVHND